jgi:GDP-L-fucose synthase
VGAKADIVFDSSKPDGTPRKVLDVTRIISLGWRPTVTLESGIALAYKDYLKSANPVEQVVT